MWGGAGKGSSRTMLVFFGVSPIFVGFVLSYCYGALGVGRSTLAAVLCPTIRVPNSVLGSNAKKLKLALKNDARTYLLGMDTQKKKTHKPLSIPRNALLLT